MSKRICEINNALIRKLCELSGQLETTISYENYFIEFGMKIFKSKKYGWKHSSKIVVHKDTGNSIFMQELEHYENYIRIDQPHIISESLLQEFLKEKEFIWVLEEALLKLI
ncbi:MAG: hypothetical protein H8D97_00490 [Proteobacteria bacterium]|nr:hypothetical protein [Pseudomonadota bacterium]